MQLPIHVATNSRFRGQFYGRRNGLALNVSVRGSPSCRHGFLLL